MTAGQPGPVVRAALDPARITSAVDAVLQGRDTPAHDLERALAEQAHRDLRAFVQQCWTILEPGRPLEWNLAFELICLVLMRVTAGELKRVVICVPPGFAKSTLVSVFWPAWWWLRDPRHRFLTLSSAEVVATRDSRKMREVIKSEWYQRLVAHQAALKRTGTWGFAKDQNEKVNFENTERGRRVCYTTDGGVTGDRGDTVIVDDPLQAKDVLGSSEQVAAALGKAHEKIDVVLPSRVFDRRTARWVTIMQRLHEDDPAGRQLKDPRVYKLVLPMHAYELDDPMRYPDDPRAPGELLDPVRFPEEEVQAEAAKNEQTAPGMAEAMFEQRPVSRAGGTFKRAWMNQEYEWDPQRPPKPYDEIVLTVDATFKASKGSAFVSVQAWGRIGWTRYDLLDEVHERLSYVDTRRVVRDMDTKWRPAAVLVEEKANGAALVDDLKEAIPRVIPFVPDKYGDKVARAQLSTPMWSAGGVWLPKGEYLPSVGDFRNELAGFPAALLKDRVDAMSQLFLWWRDRRGDGGTTAAVNQGMRDLLKAFGR